MEFENSLFVSPHSQTFIIHKKLQILGYNGQRTARDDNCIVISEKNKRLCKLFRPSSVPDRSWAFLVFKNVEKVLNGERFLTPNGQERSSRVLERIVENAHVSPFKIKRNSVVFSVKIKKKYSLFYHQFATQNYSII